MFPNADSVYGILLTVESNSGPRQAHCMPGKYTAGSLCDSTCFLFCCHFSLPVVGCMSTWVCLRDEYVPLEVWACVEHASDRTHVFDCDLGAKPSATSPPHWGMQGGSKYRKACSLFNNSFYLLQSTMQKYRVVVIASDAISRAGLCISPDPNYRTGFALSSKRMQAEAISGVDSSWNLVRVE